MKVQVQVSFDYNSRFWVIDMPDDAFDFEGEATEKFLSECDIFVTKVNG